MDTIRIRKAKSGDGFKFKYYLVEQKRDITTAEAKKLAANRKTAFDASKNLSDADMKIAFNKLTGGHIIGSVPKVAKKIKAIAKKLSKTLKPLDKSAKKVTKKIAKAMGSFDVHSRVGSQKVLEGEQLILTELRKASKALTASEIGKRIFRNELNKKGVEFVVEVRGFKFYAYLNKHYTPMVNKKLVKVVGLTKGHRKMEKLWEPINV